MPEEQQLRLTSDFLIHIHMPLNPHEHTDKHTCKHTHSHTALPDNIFEKKKKILLGLE